MNPVIAAKIAGIVGQLAGARASLAVINAEAPLVDRLARLAAVFGEEHEQAIQSSRAETEAAIRTVLKELMAESFNDAEEHFEAVPLSPVLRKKFQRLRDCVEDKELSVIADRIREFEIDALSELAEPMFLVVPKEDREMYEQKSPPFGQEVNDAFPDAEKDIADAARCFALDQWTACVFHLMRALELSLQPWTVQLGLTLTAPVAQANWQDILNAADKKLKAIEQLPKSPQRDADLEYFGTTSAQYRAIKDAWRNYVMHGKKNYDRRDSDFIFEHTKAFMVKLAAGPPVAP